MKSKKESRIHVSFLSITLFLATLAILPSCTNTKREDTKEVAEEHNEAKFDNAKEDDAQFLVTAAEINLEEINLGQLAQKNGMIPEVSKLGKMMETEHNKALDELKTLAAKKQVTLPSTITDNGLDANSKLTKKTGKDFDKEYCAMMVDGHKKAIDKFEKASTSASDQDIRTWAAGMLPTLRMHLDHAITCQKICEKTNS